MARALTKMKKSSIGLSLIYAYECTSSFSLNILAYITRSGFNSLFCFFLM